MRGHVAVLARRDDVERRVGRVQSRARRRRAHQHQHAATTRPHRLISSPLPFTTPCPYVWSPGTISERHPGSLSRGRPAAVRGGDFIARRRRDAEGPGSDRRRRRVARGDVPVPAASRGGYEVDMAAPSKKKLQFVVHDFVEGHDTYTEKPGYTWDADLAFADGRRPTMSRSWFRAAAHRSTSATTRTRRRSSAISSRAKPVAQLCHAARARGGGGAGRAPHCGVSGPRARRGDGRRRVRRRRGSGRRRDGVARAWPDHPEWMREFIKVLEGARRSRAKAAVA